MSDRMYYNNLVQFIDRCGGTVIDEETSEIGNYVTVRAEFTELRDFDVPTNVDVMYGPSHVRFDISYDLPEL